MAFVERSQLDALAQAGDAWLVYPEAGSECHPEDAQSSPELKASTSVVGLWHDLCLYAGWEI